jgi:hypothetical protein
MEGKFTMGGSLAAKKIPAAGPGLRWKLSNTFRKSFLIGWLFYHLAFLFSKITGLNVIVSKLEGRLIKADGTVINYGVLGYRYVTDNGVAFLVDDWDDDTTDITNMKYHACGTDNTAENQTDSALGTEATSITDRATGTQDQPNAYQLRSIATQSFTGSGSIVEHGLFSVVTESAGVLWDRTVFSTISVANGDSIQFTYTCTLTAGS